MAKVIKRYIICCCVIKLVYLKNGNMWEHWWQFVEDIGMGVGGRQI